MIGFLYLAAQSLLMEFSFKIVFCPYIFEKKVSFFLKSFSFKALLSFACFRDYFQSVVPLLFVSSMKEMVCWGLSLLVRAWRDSSHSLSAQKQGC